MQREETETTTFETVATCTVFEARLHGYFGFNATDLFSSAVSGLPVPFDSTDGTNLDLYRKFYGEYGTHYVSQITLGAKHVYSSVFSSTDVLELKRTGTDVGTSVSARGFGIQVSASYNYAKSESDFDQVKTKIQQVNEVNIGGQRK